MKTFPSWLLGFLLAGCGGDDFQVAVSDDAALEDTATLDTQVDMGAETRPDSTTTTDAPAEVSDTLADAADGSADSADGRSDATDATDVADVSTDSAPDVATDSVTTVDAPLDVLACEAPVTCYVDKDEDGYPATGAKSFFACECPKGSTIKSPSVVVDCNDEDSRVHPGATAFQTTAYCVPGTGCATKSFDYDCNGTEEKQYTVKFSSCSLGCAGEGLAADPPPACGATATYTTCRFAVLCNKDSSTITQGCR
ncbi:MAG: hypothetical protein JNL79_25480 [Myxococcales bacterium]|nr:hypothetical protein [Myxococcales bacterium]